MKKPFGYIYRATNVNNGKNYIGKTKDIEKRWAKHQEDAKRLKKIREANPERKIQGKHFENAIAKYGPESFKIKQEDVAYSKKELNEKERFYVKKYDSMNREKGYNMTDGGDGGRLSPEAMEKLREKMNEPEYKENMSNIITDKWRDNEYQEKQLNSRGKLGQNQEFIEKMTKINRERAKNPEWIEKMTKINQEIARTPKTQEKISRALSKKWQEKNYQENVSKGVSKKWQDAKYQERQFKARTEGRREIPDKREFIKDIQEMKKRNINEKYDMDGKSINKRIEDMLGHHGVKNYSEAKKYLEGKNLDDVLKDIKKNRAETQDEKQPSEDKDEDSKNEHNKESEEKDKEKDSNEKDSKESIENKRQDSPKDTENRVSTSDMEKESNEKYIKELNEIKREDLPKDTETKGSTGDREKEEESQVDSSKEPTDDPQDQSKEEPLEDPKVIGYETQSKESPESNPNEEKFGNDGVSQGKNNGSESEKEFQNFLGKKSEDSGRTYYNLERIEEDQIEQKEPNTHISDTINPNKEEDLNAFPKKEKENEQGVEDGPTEEKKEHPYWIDTNDSQMENNSSAQNKDYDGIDDTLSDESSSNQESSDLNEEIFTETYQSDEEYHDDGWVEDESVETRNDYDGITEGQGEDSGDLDGKEIFHSREDIKGG